MFGAIEGEEAIGFPMPGSENYVDVSSVYYFSEVIKLITCLCITYCRLPFNVMYCNCNMHVCNV